MLVVFLSQPTKIKLIEWVIYNPPLNTITQPNTMSKLYKDCSDSCNTIEVLNGCGLVVHILSCHSAGLLNPDVIGISLTPSDAEQFAKDILAMVEEIKSKQS